MYSSNKIGSMLRILEIRIYLIFLFLKTVDVVQTSVSMSMSYLFNSIHKSPE